MGRFKRKSRILSCALLAALVAFSMVAFFPAANAEPAERGIDIRSSEAIILETDHTGMIDNVRVISFFGLKGDGSVDVHKEKSLEDSGSWQGVRGFTTPVIEGDELVWKGLEVDGNANYLSSTILGEEMVGEVRMRIPLSLKYIYEWNGEIINDPNEVTGQDGHFKLYLKMRNTSAEKTVLEYRDPETGEMLSEEVETYLPLVILPYDWYFDNTIFFDLEADPTGVVVPLPLHYQVGWSIPLFPPASDDEHMIWIEADVKNFKMPPLTLSANFIFPQTNQRNTLPEFIIGLKMLFDGVQQLHEGLMGGVEGLGSADTPDTLLYGTGAILDGLKQMAAGLPEAQTALNTQLIPGVDEAIAGIGTPGSTDTLSWGIDQASLGMLEMLAGLGAPDIGGTALFAINAMTMGVEEMAAGIGSPDTPDTLLFGVEQASLGLSEMLAGIGSAAMEDTLLYGLDQMAKGLGLIKAGIGSATTDDTLLYAMAEMGGGLEKIRAGIGAPGTPDTMLYGLAAMADGLNEMLAGIGSARTPETLLYGMDQVTDGIGQVKFGLGEIYTATSPDGELRQALGLIRVLAPWTGPIVDQLENGIIFSEDPDNPSIRFACKMMSDGIGSTETKDTILYGMDEMRGGLEKMKAGIGGEDIDETLLYAVAQVQGGLQQSKDGIGAADIPDTLLFGIDQVQYGLNEILGGIGSPVTQDTLLYAVAQIQGGLELMKAGIGAANADDTLLYAMSAMSDGLNQMKEGIGTATTADTLLFAIVQVGNGLELMKQGIGAEGAPDTLLYAMAQVQHGLYLLRTGLSSGNMNDPGLKEGLIMISAGLGDAVKGLGSTSAPDTLLYGADQVNMGVEQVKEGLVQATEEGTAVMYEGLATNLASLYLTEAQLEAIRIRGEEFDHILGRTEDATNRVAFIYQTPATYNYKEGSKSSWLVAGIMSVIIIIALMLMSLALRRRPVMG
jgi:hypothetical protein